MPPEAGSRRPAVRGERVREGARLVRRCAQRVDDLELAVLRLYRERHAQAEPHDFAVQFETVVARPLWPVGLLPALAARRADVTLARLARALLAQRLFSRTAELGDGLGLGEA